MCNEVQAALINEIGEMIIEDKEYQSVEWQGLGLVVTLSGSRESMTGYRYLEDGRFEASTPNEGGDEVMDKCIELKEAMIASGNGEFLQCLIHITKPDYKLRLQFEFDDPERWAPKSFSMDMSDFANLLRPE